MRKSNSYIYVSCIWYLRSCKWTTWKKCNHIIGIHVENWGLGGDGLRNQRNQKLLRPFFCYIMRTSSPPYLQILPCKKPLQCDVWWNDALAMFYMFVRIWEERVSFTAEGRSQYGCFESSLIFLSKTQFFQLKRKFDKVVVKTLG